MNTCMSEMSVGFRQREVKRMQASQQCAVPQLVPIVALFVAIAVQKATVTPHWTLNTTTGLE